MRGLFWLYALAYQPAHASAQPPGAFRAASHADDDSLPAERLRQLKERIREGFYRRPEVIDKVARPLADDIIEADRDSASAPPVAPPSPDARPE